MGPFHLNTRQLCQAASFPSSAKLVALVRPAWLTPHPTSVPPPFLSQALIPKEHLTAQMPFTS